jgi:hypothetical protein
MANTGRCDFKILVSSSEKYSTQAPVEKNNIVFSGCSLKNLTRQENFFEVSQVMKKLSREIGVAFFADAAPNGNMDNFTFVPYRAAPVLGYYFSGLQHWVFIFP